MNLKEIFGTWLTIVLVFACLFIIAMPYILTLHGPVDFTQKGQIGDTIGGTTAPIIGIINILFLFVTLRIQQEFNKRQLEFNRTQQQVSDYDITMKIMADVTNKCDSITIPMIAKNTVTGVEIKKSTQALKELSNPLAKYHFLSQDFDVLHIKLIEIANLQILLLSVLNGSSLDVTIKRGIYNTVSQKLEPIAHLFDCYSKDWFKLEGERVIPGSYKSQVEGILLKIHVEYAKLYKD